MSDTSAKFRILVASDIHLGFNERHHERGNDSFRALEEVLSIAKEEDVDFILLGGDLFHLNKPSFQTLKRCNELLRAYCFGSRPIQFKIVSNQDDNFSHYNHFKYANYLDPNLNVSMPVFTIHGNHDDPTGANPISSLETLSSSGLINYFGKYTNVDEILLTPILLQKADIKIALYGLGSVNEERLYRIVTNGKLNYCMPAVDEDDWFKIVVVHQNRIKHGNTKYLPERFLSKLPDLVIWGHEHESKTETDYNEMESFHVYQPGSTVATSLCEAESGAKHCGILEVFLDHISQTPKFRITPKQLKSVRQLIWRSIYIPDLIRRRQVQPTEQAIEEYCKEKVESMVLQARLEHTGDRRQPKLPLIRLRLEYTDEYQKFHIAKFGSYFEDKVANASEIVAYVKRKHEDNDDQNNGDIDLNEMRNLLDQEVIGERVNIKDIIKEYFSSADERSQLSLLSENALTLAVNEFVDKDSTEAITEMYESQKERVKQHLLSLSNITLEEVRDKITTFRTERMRDEDSDIARILQESRKKKNVKTETVNNDNSDIFMENMQSDNSDEEMPQTSGRGRGATRGRGRGRGRGKKNDESVVSSGRASQRPLDIFEVASTSSRTISTSQAKRQKMYTISDSD